MTTMFVSDFLDFVRDNKINVNTTYSSLVLNDSEENEIATINSDGNVSVPINCGKASQEFIMLLLDNKVKIVPIKDKEYKFYKSFDFTINNKVCLSVTMDNKISINL